MIFKDILYIVSVLSSLLQFPPTPTWMLFLVYCDYTELLNVYVVKLEFLLLISVFLKGLESLSPFQDYKLPIFTFSFVFIFIFYYHLTHQEFPFLSRVSGGFDF